jgi:coenzyme F420 hydrogenase subunit beta
MRLPVIQSVRDVAEYQLCSGCGACAAFAPGAITMVDDLDHGRRPIIAPGGDEPARRALRVCPGIELAHDNAGDNALLADLRAGWGPVRRVWEGHAGDAAIRHAGSSGGAASALALWSLERGGMHGVIHAAARQDAPYLNETVISRTRDELLARTGSRYAPASPCDGLGMAEAAPAPCVFIGKPCDVAGAAKLARERPALAQKLGLTIAFFCAGAPSTRGTLDLMKKVGVPDPRTITALRYRGNGWPGRWTVRWTDAAGNEHERSLTYDESWGFLQKYRQWRCYICPDHTGEFADVAVGDPWHTAPKEGEAGRSLILARTARGERAIEAAARDGYLVLEREDAQLLPRSQPNLLTTRGRLWGQLMALRIKHVPTPRYRGFKTLKWWIGLSLRDKAQSTLGTVRRVTRRGLRDRVPVRAFTEASQKGAGA